MNATFTRSLVLLAVLTAPIFTTARAQTDSESSEVPAEESRSIPLLTAEQLDELLGPIALYPDALIALILPASTMPTDLVLASRYIAAAGDKSKVDEQPWDESIRALAHYPDVVTWMDEKLSWAIMVGDAFIAQPVDVMQSIQRLRARARAAGTLTDSPEQKVVEEEGTISIVPAQPEVIYVPVYDPRVVYVSRSPYWGWGWSTSVITYRWSYPTGIWLSYGCDWYNHRVWVVNTPYRHHWYHNHGWRKPYPRHHNYDHGHKDGGFGRPWMPRHGGHHPDYRRNGRDRESHVVVRDGHRDRGEFRRAEGRRPDGQHVDRSGGNDGRPRGDGSLTPRRDRSQGDSRTGTPVVRDERSPRRNDPATPRATSPESRRSAPPVKDLSPRIPSTRTAPALAQPTERDRTPTSGSGRWIDRARQASSSTRIRSETPASSPRVADPAPRVASSPRSSATSRVVPAATPPRPAAPRVAPAPERAPKPQIATPSPARSAQPPHRTAIVRSSQPPASARSAAASPAPSSGGSPKAAASPRGNDRSGRSGGGGDGGRRAANASER